jgi:two-component system, LytTR family, sensor histidine kinase AlgZ
LESRLSAYLETLMDDDVETVSVPREVLWLCLVAPLLFVPLMTPGVYALSWDVLSRRLLGAYAPFLLTPLLVKLSFDRLAPRWLRGVRSSWGRFVRYGILASAASLVASLLTLPLCQYLVGPERTLTITQHLLNGLIITWIIALPSVAFEQQRKRALRSERQARAERQAALEAQLAALSARMQPHFFFNSVNTVASLIPEDPDRAEQTLIRLADILRYALEGGRTRFVSLQRELEMVRDYLEVQQARFESKLRWSIDAAPELAGVAVPRLFLQPLVENAVLHGVAQRSTGGEVRVRARLEASSAWIEVTDDGVGPDASQHHGNGTALVDLAARLQLLYGAEGRLESEARAGGGFRVRVTVPAQELASCE